MIKNLVRLRVKFELKNLNKIYFPDDGYTKGDVINYYKQISDIILPHLRNRPENLNRHPGGISEEGFFQKNVEKIAPNWAKTIKIPVKHDKSIDEYLICNDLDTLLWMNELGCIEINPWSSRVNNLNKPDYMIIDLDPGQAPFEYVIKTAMWVRKILDSIKVESYVKTSGGSGLHIFVPTEGKYSYKQIRAFAELVVTIVNKSAPEITTLERGGKNRRHQVYLDYLQNGKGQTVVSAYSLRPRRGALVSTPLRWSEVKPGLDPKKFNIKTVFNRIDKYGDLFIPTIKKGINLNAVISSLQQSQI